MNELVILDGVDVGYGKRPILSGVNLVLRRGRFTALVGVNGSGKSTLLKTILGLLPPLGGQIVRPSFQGAPAQLGYVPQRDSLDSLFLFTSLEVVLQACCVRVRPGRFFNRGERAWALDCLRAVGAADLATTRFSLLSGGQKQRVLIARALAVRPDLLVLDEPTAGIDSAATKAVLELLHKAHTDDQLGILMVTHEMGGLRTFVQDVIVLNHGKAQHGAAEQLLSPNRSGPDSESLE